MRTTFEPPHATHGEIGHFEDDKLVRTTFEPGDARHGEIRHIEDGKHVRTTFKPPHASHGLIWHLEDGKHVRTTFEFGDAVIIGAARSIEAIFNTDVRTPPPTDLAELATSAGFAGLPAVLLQEVATKANPATFRALSLTCKSLHNALAFTAPGLKAARSDGAVSLYPWQASNVRKLVAFLQGFHRRIAGKQLPLTEGFVLCDAPGGGKTVSVLATVVRTMPTRPTDPLLARRHVGVCIIFAPKVIVPQWADQISRHFDASVSGLRLYCDSSEMHLYDDRLVTPLTRAELERRTPFKVDDEDYVSDNTVVTGGVYIEQRPSADLPPIPVLAGFSMLVLSKELLSMRTESLYATNSSAVCDAIVRQLRNHVRLVVIDESHNLSSSGQITNQMLNVEAFAGVPKLLMSGTPGIAPRRLYDMLALIKHTSWRAGGGYRKWLKSRFVPSTHQVLPKAEGALLTELNSCFLHTPPEVIFEERAPHRTTCVVEPSDIEAMSYNYVLSLHHRDVIRAGAGKTKPAEWTRGKGNAARTAAERSGPQSQLKEASAEKTMGELMCAVNGGELWAVNTKRVGNGKDSVPKELPHVHPPYLDRLVTLEGKAHPEERELPECSSCHLSLPGVLSLPCACDAEIVLCPECFRDEVGDFRAKCVVCKQSRKPFRTWVATQPWLEVQSKAEVEYDVEQMVSAHMQHQNHLNHVHNIVLSQPPKRPFSAVTARNEDLAATPDEVIKAMTANYAKLGELAILLKKLKYPLGAAGRATDAKVLIVPPSHKDVRDTFISSLREALGRDALSDLNDLGSGGKKDTKLETALAIAKFRRGRGAYWQCAHCGEVYEEATTGCKTPTFRVALEATDGQSVATVVRFGLDVVKVDHTGCPESSQTVFIDNRVVLCTPGQRRQIHDPYGKVIAKGSCHGKRPTAPSAFIPAPADSCFVLILNASGIEGLDLGEATHLIKTEPIVRDDKERQAEARGRRLGASGRLQIIQMLMASTIEQATMETLAEARKLTAEKSRGAAGTSRDDAERGAKRERDAADVDASDEADGKQAALLNSLKLLRHDEDQ